MQGLKDAGFVEGQNVTIEARWANDQYDRLPAMAADLVRARVALIFTYSNNLPTRAAKNATSTIPIVFVMGADPVQLGLVDGLSRPGGNITGQHELVAFDLQPADGQLTLSQAQHLALGDDHLVRGSKIGRERIGGRRHTRDSS
jgi:ABC-type uncharacterized transport system substrate-binding protein